MTWLYCFYCTQTFLKGWNSTTLVIGCSLLGFSSFLSVSLCNLSTSIVIGFTSTRRRLRRFFFWPPTSDVFKLGRSSKFKSWSPESSRCKGSDIVISTVTYAKFAILRFWHFFIGYFGVTFGQSVFELLHWSQRLSQIGRPNCSQFAAGRQRQGHLLFGS